MGSLSEKNLSPRQIAVYTALVTTLTVGLSLLLLRLAFDGQLLWWHLVLVSLLTFVVAYFINVRSLERFIYQRVQLIYKTIRKTKASKKKESKQLDMNSHVIDEVEEEVKIWANERDKEITSLRKMEAYRRDFIGNISHELKTPIFNVQGFIHTLLEGGLYDEKINMLYLERAAKNVERLNTIVADLDMIAQIESEDLLLDIQRFDIHKLTQEIFDELGISAQEKKIRFEFDQGSDRAFNVVADRERIRQVLVNLMTNSIKYGKKEGRTRIGFYDMDDKHLLIEVADDGYGIDSKHLPRLFERFYRVDKGRSREEGGSGLGLSIVKHIIEAHKQTVNVRSTLNVGSTFGFTLDKP